MVAAMSDVDVVVVAYNNVDLLRICLDQVRTLPTVRSVTVVDNGGDGSAALAEFLGATVLRRPDNPGFGTSQNLGVAAGAAPTVLLLNPDAVLRPGAVEAGLDVLRNEPDVAAVQGVIIGPEGVERSAGMALRPLHLLGRTLRLRSLRNVPGIRRLASRSALGSDHLTALRSDPTDVEYLAATALLVRRTAFESVGGFDERFFLYAEDDDLCRRLRAQHWRLVSLPTEWASHANGGSSAGSWDREVAYWNGAMTLGAKWFTPWQWRVTVASAILRTASLMIRRPNRAMFVLDLIVRRPVGARGRYRLGA